MKKTIATAVFLFAFLFQSCENFDYNVYQTNKHEKDETVTTSYNLNRILSLPQKDTLHVVFTGDTQRFYDDVEDMVEVINDLPIVDAVIITGDLSDFSVDREYEWMNNELKKLEAPFLTVIGNHDCLANGTKLYEEFYGPLNYSFTWNDVRFVMHNTNSREFAFNGYVPDISWMQNQINDTSNFNCCIFVSHVPPNNPDFDKVLEDDYTQLIRNAKNIVFSSNGHNHDKALGQPYNDGIWYLNTSSPVNRFLAYVKIYPYAQDKKFDCEFVAF